MAYTRAVEKWSAPFFNPITAVEEEGWLSADVETLKPIQEKARTGDIDVTGKSELRRIYADWVGWVGAGSMAAAAGGLITLICGLVFRGDVLFLVGAIALAFGLMAFQLTIRAATKMRLRFSRDSDVS